MRSIDKHRKIKTYELEKMVVEHFRPRQNLVVPNVSWGFFGHGARGSRSHEADILVCTDAGCLYEVELKVSKSDLLADMKKHHHHFCPRLKYVWFAVPFDLVETAEKFLDPRFGIMYPEWRDIETPYWDTHGWHIVVHRKPQKLSDYQATEKERQDLLRLCALRVWGLKSKLAKIMSRDR